MVIYLVRHGEDNNTVRGGWSSEPLTMKGRSQAEHLAESVYQDKLLISHIFSSDLPRALQTAEPIAQRLGLPVIPVPQFREVNNGELAGMDNAVAAQKYPGLYWNQLEWEQHFPGGESPKAFYERVKAAWQEFTEKQKENALLVTHSGVIHIILSIVNRYTYSNQDKQPKVNHCELIAVEGDRCDAKVLRSL